MFGRDRMPRAPRGSQSPPGGGLRRPASRSAAPSLTPSDRVAAARLAGWISPSSSPCSRPRGCACSTACPRRVGRGRRPARSSRLRKQAATPPTSSSAVSPRRGCARARPPSSASSPTRMLFTAAGLEQATRLSVAARHAGRFRDAGMSRSPTSAAASAATPSRFAALGLRVTAVDADEVTAAIAAYNLAPFGDAVTRARTRRHARERVRATPRGRHPIPPSMPWLDPARRTAGHSETSRTRPEDWSPALDFVFGARRARAGRREARAGRSTATLIPDDVEAQWVSADGVDDRARAVVGRARADGRAPGGARDPRRRRAGADAPAADAADEPGRPARRLPATSRTARSSARA